MRKILQIILVFIFISSCHKQTTFAQSTDTFWNMAGANPQRTSWVNQSFSTGGYGVIWSLPVEAYIDQKTQIVSAESDAADTVYLATTRGLYAVQASSGTVRWKFNSLVPVATPTVIGNTVYFGSLDKKVYALNGSTGAVIWSTAVDSGISTNPIVENGRVYIGSRGGYFYAFNSSNGSIAWQYPAANSAPLGTIAYSAVSDGTNIYFGTNDMYAYALNAGSGALTWKSSQPLTGERLESWWPVIIGNYVVFTLSPEYRYGLNPGNMTISTSGEFTNGGGADSGVEKRDTFGTDNTGYIGNRMSSSGLEWPSGTAVIDTQSAPAGGTPLSQYYSAKPYRASFISLNRSNGTVAHTVPITFQGTKNGMHYPPLVNESEGALYAIGGFQDASWIPRALLYGWKPGGRYVKEAGHNLPIDEPVAFSAKGTTIFANLCCDRMATGFWPYAGGNPGPLASMTPGYDAMWEPFDGGGIDRLKYVYAGLAQNYGFVRQNGVYGSHGNQNPLIPYANKVFTHRSNAIIALGSGGAVHGGGSKSANNPLTISTTADSSPTANVTSLRNRLHQEINRILEVYTSGSANRFLKPGSYNLGQPSNAQNGNREFDYFSNPGDTIDVLSYAYTQISDTNLKARLKSYLQDFYQTYLTANIARIGWTRGSQRTNSFPQDLNSMNLPGDVSGFEVRSMYGLYRYAKIFNLSTERSAVEQIYTFAQSKLQSGCSNINASSPWKQNECIAHLQGFLNIQKLLGVSENATVRQNLNSLFQQRTTGFNKNWPGTGQSKDRKYNVSRNFQYLVPELGSYWRTNAGTTITNAIKEYEYLAPFWFVEGNDNTEEESVMQPLNDVWLFQAKAHVQNLSGQQLYSYLDAPAFYRGDLYFINNLTTVLERLDPNVTPVPMTPNPTPTGGSGGLQIGLTVLLHGIGRGGDNVSPNSIGTMNPLRINRTVLLELTNTNNQTITRQGNVIYNSNAGNFQGNISTSGIASGAYTLKIGSSQYLKKTVPGIISISSSQNTTISPVYLITGDTSLDNSLSILDYNIILDCFSELGAPRNCTDANKKLNADITDDGSVNQFDYNLFLRELSVQSGQ